MIAVVKPAKRTRGRPPARSDEETRGLIGQAALAEFIRHGYAATCVAVVARGAGVSTRTLYRLVPTKAELFALSVEKRLDLFMVAADEDRLAALPLDQALEALLFAYGTLVLGPDAIAMTRLLYAESDRFPDLAARYEDSTVTRVDGAIARWLEREQRQGRLRLPGGNASGFLRGMMIGAIQRPVLLRLIPPPDPEAIAERARTCARLFLDGCRA